MAHRELLRWCGSIGIFYILIPAYLVLSNGVLSSFIPWPAPALDATGVRGAFAISGAVGLTLAFLSIRAQVTRGRGHPFDMTGSESFSRPTQVLLTTGVYALSRNPMGLGDILFYIGITGLAQCWWSLVLQVPAYAVIVVWNHRWNERPALLGRFGEEYRAYEHRTPLLIPGPRSLRAAFSQRTT